MNQKLTSCSVLARFHHTAKRARLAASVRIITPVVGSGDVLAGDRRHDARDVGAHPETLVADPVALREVVDAAGAGEDERAEQQRDGNRVGIGQRPEAAHGLRQIGPGGGLDRRHDRHRQEHERERDLEELRTLERLVHHRRHRQREADGDHHADGDVADVAAADQERECGDAARGPARPHVRHQREQTEDPAPVTPAPTKPAMAVSPVTSVYRSISMLMKYWNVTLTTAAHRKAGPTADVMKGQMMYSPEPTPSPARMTLGPRIFVSGSGSGMSRTDIGGRHPAGTSLSVSSDPGPEGCPATGLCMAGRWYPSEDGGGRTEDGGGRKEEGGRKVGRERRSFRPGGSTGVQRTPPRAMICFSSSVQFSTMCNCPPRDSRRSMRKRPSGVWVVVGNREPGPVLVVVPEERHGLSHDGLVTRTVERHGHDRRAVPVVDLAAVRTPTGLGTCALRDLPLASGRGVAPHEHRRPAATGRGVDDPALVG